MRAWHVHTCHVPAWLVPDPDTGNDAASCSPRPEFPFRHKGTTFQAQWAITPAGATRAVRARSSEGSIPLQSFKMPLNAVAGRSLAQYPSATLRLVSITLACAMLLITCATSLAQEQNALGPIADTPDPATTEWSEMVVESPPAGQFIVNYAMQFYGYPYVAAGNGPGGFDCSGFTQFVMLNMLGIDIGHGVAGQTGYGYWVDWGNWQPGDLVFFAGTTHSGISHVGIYIGEGQFIHAENESTGVTISSVWSNYYSNHYAGAYRLI